MNVQRSKKRSDTDRIFLNNKIWSFKFTNSDVKSSFQYFHSEFLPMLEYKFCKKDTNFNVNFLHIPFLSLSVLWNFHYCWLKSYFCCHHYQVVLIYISLWFFFKFPHLTLEEAHFHEKNSIQVSPPFTKRTVVPQSSPLSKIIAKSKCLNGKGRSKEVFP